MQNVYTVAQINAYIKNMFTQDYLLQSISVKGEVSNCKYHSSGHIYFTLKDGKGTISCVMFAGNRSGLSFRMSEGIQVIVEGTVTVYERDGRYQMYARRITQDGAGFLYEQFELKKAELEERGMFAQEYKQPIPFYSKTLGVVTADTGAAVRDIINIATRRNPYIRIILYPAIVQGEQAACSIVKGIHILEQMQVDVMIVGRGGGSIEDLWAFNEEAVAQAIFDCQIPIISAVGHETDITIADFVADLRAPTPSAAAELAICDMTALIMQLADMRTAIKRTMDHKLEKYKLYLTARQSRLQLYSPMNRLREKRTWLLHLEEQLENAMQGCLLRDRHRLELYIERLRGLSPLDKLNQGFSYVADEQGKTITNIHQVVTGQRIDVHVKNGIIQTSVTDTIEMNRK